MDLSIRKMADFMLFLASVTLTLTYFRHIVMF